MSDRTWKILDTKTGITHTRTGTEEDVYNFVELLKRVDYILNDVTEDRYEIAESVEEKEK